MAYLKINGVDYSQYVNSLKIKNQVKYTSQTNAAGNTIVDYINNKRLISVGIIPLDDVAMKNLQTAISKFSVILSFRNPNTGALEEVECIIPENEVDYYTIQINKVMYKAFTLQFTEL